MSDDDYELDDLDDEVEACVRSVKKQEGMDKSSAIAICKDMQNKGQLTEPDEEHREQTAETEGLRVLETSFDAPGPVQRVKNEDEDAVTYKNLLFLAPGEWTDAAEGEQIYYSPEANKRLAEKGSDGVVDTAVNVNHEHRDQLKQVGSYDPGALDVDDHGNLYGDLTLHGRTQASEDAIGLMDLALESDGQQGAGGLSVEIPLEHEKTEWDKERGMEKMVEYALGGLAIVTNSASEPAAFDQQFDERAIAMASGDDVDVRVMQRDGQTDIKAQRPAESMDDVTEAIRTLADEDGVTINIEGGSMDEINDALDGDDDDTPDEPEQTLEDDEDDEREELMDDDEHAVVQDVIERAESEGFDVSEQTAAELMDFVGTNMDLDEAELDAIENVAEAYLQATDADSLDATPAEGLLDFVREQASDDDDEEDEGDEEEAPDEDDEEDEEMDADEDIEELQAKNEELSDTVEELERRLSELEDEPERPRSLGSQAEAEETDTQNPQAVKSGLSHDGDYITR